MRSLSESVSNSSRVSCSDSNNDQFPNDIQEERKDFILENEIEIHTLINQKLPNL